LRRATSLRTGEQGLALIVTLLAMSLMMALGMALVLTTMTESRIASGYRDGAAALYAADAIIERALRDVLAAPDVHGILDGTVVSEFTDGPAGGVRRVPGGGDVDLTKSTELVRAGNPLWQLYAYGAVGSSYTAVWVAPVPERPGRGAIALLAHAYGPGGVRRALEVIAERSAPGVIPPAVRVLIWRELMP
jgi:hypothetical protein